MEAPTPDYFHQSGFYQQRSSAHQFTPEKRLPVDPKQEPFVVEEFFDFSNDEESMSMVDVKPPLAFDAYHNAGGGLNSAESSSVTAVDHSFNSNSFSEPYVLGEIGQRSQLVDRSFAGELCVPYEDLAELEWLSTITEESLSSEDMQKLQLISGMTARLDESRIEPNKPDFSEVPVPGKARSKRSRAAHGSWASRLLVLSPTSSATSETDHPTMGGKSIKAVMKKKDGPENGPSDGRRCLHCATDKTPQWRTGPMGPKTLCNACGVRYKSGRLVPEYRPAASPTFVQTKHSNSHRKVLELRRQKEVQRPHPHPHPNPHHIHPHQHHHHHQQFLQHHQNMIFDVSNGDDYLIHHHLGPDYRQLI